MTVPWWSQTDYSKEAFGWWTVFAAWELTTAVTGWMYHQARQQGDAGTIYRIMTWVFASGAAAINYAHHCGPGGRPTQASVAFATLSVVGMVLWGCIPPWSTASTCGSRDWSLEHGRRSA